jgi:superfamily II DNA/RNA helicase
LTDQSNAPEDEDPAAHAHLVAQRTVREDSPAFADFDIHPLIVEALADAGIVRTFAIQELTLPIALAGSDLIGQARTGTGKTLGFGVPLLNRLEQPGLKGARPQALVIAPTRELASQVSGDVAAAGAKLGARVVTIYGGRAYEPQIEALTRGVDVVVGTPGRLLDLAEQGKLDLSGIRMLVLDEADEMLDLGFLPDIEKLMARIPSKHQTMLFSATMPGPIVALARQFLNQPIQIRAESADAVPATEHIDQFVYRAHALDKVEVLARILQARDRGLTMIFVRTKRTAAKVAEDLEDRGFAAGAVHGDLGQGAREQALRAFRSGKVDVLVATDVAARGLDVEGVTHVINYQCPEDSGTYVHRIGRTARAGASGTAVTLVDWDDVPRWQLICDQLKLPMHEPPETYSTSPHLYVELGIPEGITGSLPRAQRTRAGLDAEQIEDLGGRDPSAAGSGTGTGGRRGSSRTRQGGGSAAPASSAPRAARPARPARASSDDAAGPSGAGEATESAARRRRPRRRTRGGQAAVDGAVAGSAGAGVSTAVAENAGSDRA